jgi:glycosyltransferase involved in cell wall biosynthesis
MTKVSLIATVKDAGPYIAEFLTSIEGQTRAPDQVVIVDGGSTDGTLEALRATPWVTLLEEPGANIARGRNLAIAKASHDTIAVSDADCVLAPDWLERIVELIEGGASVSMGTYRPLTSSFFEACAAAISIKELQELRPETYMPSARSVAFTREAFDAGGGYPEWLDIGEDMYLNRMWKKAGVGMELAAGAVVYRRPRPGPRAYWRQFVAYAEGDALGGMHPKRHAARFAAYGMLAIALASRTRLLKGAVLAAGGAYAARPIGRAFRRMPPGPRRLAAIPSVPALMGFTDLAKMTGYLRGIARRRGTR